MSEIPPLRSPSLDGSARRGWRVAVAGLGLVVFAVSALSNPGRLDITDGQTRYAVAESLYEYGDSAVRDPRPMFAIYFGRDGREYAIYRAPHSVLGAAAIALADATGPVREGRRHFFFICLGGVAAAILAMMYAVWFRRAGLPPGAALLWAAGGYFCTPAWYYSTSTFDDIFGTTTVVTALILALIGRRAGSGRGLLIAAAAGALLGLAFNWKQPLAVFALPVLAALDNPAAPVRVRLGRAALLALGVALGVAAEVGYNWAKFPGGVPDLAVVPFSRINIRVVHFAASPLPGLASLIASPGCGMVWYCPPVFLGLYGLATKTADAVRFRTALVVALGVLGLFVSWLTYFKGDISWGPRYLTPVFAVLWLFAPVGFRHLGRVRGRLLLAAGLAVQLLGLAVDPHRLYAVENLGGGFYNEYPWGYFALRASHLPNRLREIRDVLTREPDPTAEVMPGSPTFGFPLTCWPEPAMLRYQAVNAPRPWWGWMPALAPERRPFDLAWTAGGLAAAALCGVGMLLAGRARLGRPSEAVGHSRGNHDSAERPATDLLSVQ
jgi:hypothetical protein